MKTITVEKIDQFIAENQENIVRDIARLIAVRSDTAETAPQALQTALSIAEDMGLSVHNEKNIIGWVQLGEDAEKYLATITHTDVVPAGEGWTVEPFSLTQQEGWLMGRGVVDDKGAAVLTLYLLKFFKEQQFPLRYPIRALFGTDEETGMSDVKYYLQHFPAPVFCFTPDADFPLCHGEKGLYGARIISPVIPDGDILAIQGGFAPNAVPATAKAEVRFEGAQWVESPGVTAVLKGGKAFVTAVGKSGHASLPEGTVNAIGLLIEALLKNGIGNPAERAYLQVLQQLHASTDGSALGIASDDGLFSPLTIVGGMILKEDSRIIQTVDSRFPTSISAESITQALKNAAGSYAEVDIVPGSLKEPFYIKADHPAITACLQAYAQATGQEAKPFTMGGGTYARQFPCAASFGPQPRDLVRPEGYGTEHGANEAIPLKSLLTALKIYILAMGNLQEMEL